MVAAQRRRVGNSTMISGCLHDRWHVPRTLLGALRATKFNESLVVSVFFVVFGCFAILILFLSRPRRSAATFGRSHESLGLVLPMRPIPLATTGAIALLGLVMCGLAVAGMARGAWPAVLLFPFGLAFLALGPVNLTPQCRHPLPLLLTPHGVRRRVGGKDAWVAWDDILDVKAYWSRVGLSISGPVMNRLALKTSESGKKTFITDRIHLDLLDVEPTVAHCLLHH